MDLHIYNIYMIETCIAGLEDNTQAETHHSGSPSCKRQIRLTNLRFKERIGRFPAAVSLLNKIGCSAVKLMAVRMEDNGSSSSDLACFHMFSLPSSNDAMRALFPSLPSHCIILYPIQLGESYRPCKDLTAQVLNNAIAADKDIIINKK